MEAPVQGIGYVRKFRECFTIDKDGSFTESILVTQYISNFIDESLDIDWIIPTEKALLSDKDTKHALLKDFDSPFDINVSLY